MVAHDATHGSIAFDKAQKVVFFLCDQDVSFYRVGSPTFCILFL
jgi:hypothetical protein